MCWIWEAAGQESINHLKSTQRCLLIFIQIWLPSNFIKILLLSLLSLTYILSLSPSLFLFLSALYWILSQSSALFWQRDLSQRQQGLPSTFSASIPPHVQGNHGGRRPDALHHGGLRHFRLAVGGLGWHRPLLCLIWRSPTHNSGTLWCRGLKRVFQPVLSDVLLLMNLSVG